MRAKHWVGVGIVLAVIGATLAFALDDGDSSAFGISLEPFGGVLLATGALLLAGAGIASMADGGNSGHGGNGPDSNSLKAVGGLIAVVAALVAVVALAIVTVARLDGDKTDSMIAVTTSAFGIISAVVGAYLGIKISAETSAQANDEAKQAAVAQHEADVAKEQVSALERKVDEAAPNVANAIKTAGYRARDKAARTVGTAPGATGGA